MNFIIKKVLEQKIDKEDKKYIAPHFPGGVVTPDDLRKIADMCEKFPESKLKLTGEIIIGNVKDETRNKECRQILGLPTYSVAGFSMRPVKLCSGGYICDNNVRDSFSLGLTLDKKFSGRRLPFKMIISVSGCSRSCSEPLVKDIGVVASKEGYSLFVGGAAGRKPRIAQRLLDNLNEQEVIHAVERIVNLYEKKGRTPERLGIFIEKMGLEKFREECGFYLSKLVKRGGNQDERKN